MSMLRFDPFRDLDRLTSEWIGGARTPRWAPMDAYRVGEEYVVHLDLPGIAEDSLEVTAENNTLTVRAERRPAGPDNAQYVINERPMGAFSRQMVLGDGLDLDKVSANYHDGVLTVTIPVAEQAKPRRIDIEHGDQGSHKVITGSTR